MFVLFWVCETCDVWFGVRWDFRVLAICDLSCLGCPFRIFQIFAVLIFFCLVCIWFWVFRVCWFCGLVGLLVLMTTLLLGLVRDRFSRDLGAFGELVDLGFRFLFIWGFAVTLLCWVLD